MNRTWQVGDRVLAWRARDHCLWYPATVRNVEGDRCSVEFADGQISWLPPDQLLPLEVSQSSRVQCRWNAGSVYYPGTIVAKDGPKIHLKYDDGTEEWADIGLLRISGGVPTSARSYLIWTHSSAEADKSTLVRLTPEALTLAVVPKAELDAVVAALGDGGTVAGQVIPLAALAKIEGGENESSLTVTYKTGTSKTKSETIQLADATAQEGLLGALTEQLRPGWRRQRQQTSRWVAGAAILGGMAVVVFLSRLFYFGAERIAAGKHLQPRDGTAKQIIYTAIGDWFLGLIGPTGVLIVGGICLVLGLLGLLGVLVYPPARVVVEPVQETGTFPVDPGLPPTNS